MKYKYLNQGHLKGFNNYKYSAIDSSPLSKYVMHPTWNTIVKFIPNWVAPNLLTFLGFLCMVTLVVILSVLDYNSYSSGRPGNHEDIRGTVQSMPDWVLTLGAVLIFFAYHLDGVDGKQARKIGVSGPLGELFDHGLDSYIVFFIPFCLLSVFGRDEFSVTLFRGYLMIMSVVLNFYTSHCEKYNTGTLFLPWGYDLSMWASTLLFLVAGIYGPGVYKVHLVGNITFMQVAEVTVHATGLFTTLPVAIWNVYLHRKENKGKKRSIIEAVRPVWSMLTMVLVMTAWALKSPKNILEYDPRAFLMLFGTLFSQIASRLIVDVMGSQRCELVNWLMFPLVTGLAVVYQLPHLEPAVLYSLLVLCIVAHVHYGTNVVKEICHHFRVNCFTVPKAKRK